MSGRKSDASKENWRERNKVSDSEGAAPASGGGAKMKLGEGWIKIGKFDLPLR